ncbi:hypothetical protein [uncultured Bacteroides sp.]|uniref:hypothetical protein n=1 Tax=uncultured Bacteroides sp. TaxID=162156 RepID=UPI002AA94EB9|nr:hypothetical protein [uncultured Bacteroides sp.]
MNKVILIGFCIILFSCSRGSDDVQEPSLVIDKYQIVFAFSGEKSINDFVLYIGPKGENQDTGNLDPKKIWKNRFESNRPDSIIFCNDSDLILKFTYSPEKYIYKNNANSVYIKRNNNTWSFLGTKSDKGFIYNKGFYFITTPHGYLGSFWQIGSDYGIQNYGTRFFDTAVLPKPEALTDKRDTVAWCNGSYLYKKVVKNRIRNL